MQRQSNTYIFGFAVVITLFSGVIIAVSSTALKPKQRTEVRLDVVRNILSVSGFGDDRIRTMGTQEVLKSFKENFEPLLLDRNNSSVDRTLIEESLAGLGYGADYLAELYTFELVQIFNFKLPLLARRAGMKVQEFDPGYKLIFLLKREGVIDKYVIPIEGYGLWGMMYGYISLQSDLNTVAGIRFYKHQETPGLGGECEKPWFTDQYLNKKILDSSGKLVSVNIVKGKVKDLYEGEAMEHYIDGISGATITGNSINAYLYEDLEKFEPYFKTIRNGGTHSQMAPENGTGGDL